MAIKRSKKRVVVRASPRVVVQLPPSLIIVLGAILICIGDFGVKLNMIPGTDQPMQVVLFSILFLIAIVVLLIGIVQMIKSMRL